MSINRSDENFLEQNLGISSSVAVTTPSSSHLHLHVNLVLHLVFQGYSYNRPRSLVSLVFHLVMPRNRKNDLR